MPGWACTCEPELVRFTGHDLQYYQLDPGRLNIAQQRGLLYEAAAWGNNDRLTNPFYRQLRQLVYFGNHGQVYMNRSLADWHRWGEIRPYTAALQAILGAPIAPGQMWQGCG